MRSLGVNPTSNGMWLACAEDGEIIPLALHSLALPSGLEAGEQLTALLDECERVIRDVAPDRVVILDPEGNAQLKFASARGRATGETLLALAAAKADIPCEKLPRARLRSRLGLERSGKLSELVPKLVAVPLSPHWKDGRDLAALAALAVEKAAENAEG